MTGYRTFAAAALIAAGSAAHADTVRMQFVGVGAARVVKATIGSTSVNCYAGQLLHTFSNGNGVAAGLTGTKVTFCTDLTQEVTSTGDIYTVAPIANLPQTTGWPNMGPTRAQAVYDLYAAAAGQESAANANPDFAAAFQIALWEIAYDYTGSLSSLNLGAGNVKICNTNNTALSGTLMADVNQLFSQIGAGVVQQGLLGLSNDCAQDQILEVQTVPIPASLPAGLAGLGLVALARRRMTAR